MKRHRSLLTVVTILSLALAVSAHDTWLVPRVPIVPPGIDTWLLLTSGMAFPVLDTSINSDRVDLARCRLNDKVMELSERKSQPHALSLGVKFNEPGIATCWVELKPRQLELTPSQVEEYFAEIDATRAVRQAWGVMKSPKRWREVYVKHAKTFITVGALSNNSWKEPVGMSLELVPETDPTKLQPGADFVVRVLKDGNPFKDFRVGIGFEGNKDLQFHTTDDRGRVRFQLKRVGKYMVRATDLKRSNKPDLEWESDFTTLTIQTMKVYKPKTH